MPFPLLVAAALGGAPKTRPENGGAAWPNVVGFSQADIAATESGQVVARVVPTRDDNDVVIAGATRLGAPKEALVEELRGLHALAGARVVSCGRFSDPARLEDLAGLEFDRQDLADLRKCRPGDCDLKLGASGMEISREVDWKAPGAAGQAARLLKQSLVDAVEAYRAQGAMGVYLDNENPEKVAEELDKVLEDSPHPAPDPALLRYVLEYPKGTLADSEDVFYWSKAKFQKSVVSLHHLVIHKDAEGPVARYNVADKHILDSHYFLGYLDMLTVTDDAPSGASSYLVRVNRSRIDPPRKLRGMLLHKIKGRMLDLMVEDLRLTKARLEKRPSKE